MNKREAKKLAYGEIAAFVDAELPDLFEMIEMDPDMKRSASDLERIRAALEEIVNELRDKAA